MTTQYSSWSTNSAFHQWDILLFLTTYYFYLHFLGFTTYITSESHRCSWSIFHVLRVVIFVIWSLIIRFYFDTYIFHYILCWFLISILTTWKLLTAYDKLNFRLRLKITNPFYSFCFVRLDNFTNNFELLQGYTPSFVLFHQTHDQKIT